MSNTLSHVQSSLSIHLFLDLRLRKVTCLRLLTWLLTPQTQEVTCLRPPSIWVPLWHHRSTRALGSRAWGLEAAGGVVSQDGSRGTSVFGVLRRCWGQHSLGTGQESFSEGGGV